MIPSSTPADGVRPRPVVDRLPHYAAGKPPVAVAGLTSYKLSSNENPLPPLPEVAAAIAGRLDFNRYPDPLSTRLRTALAGHLDVPAEDIVTGAGSLGALNQVLAAFAGQNDDGEPDEVVYAWRSFEAYPISVGLSGAAGVQIPLTADGRHDLAAMAAAVTPRTRVVLLCTPNNPTGPAITEAETEEFLRAVPEDVVVVIDEAYLEFVRAEGAVNGIGIYRKYPNVVVLRTFSKAFGLAGLRVGYSISQPALTRYLRAAATPFAVSQIAEEAAVVSLQHYGRIVERVQTLVDERTRVMEGLRALGWRVPDAQGNFVWLDLGADSADFAAYAGAAALSVRAFAGDGVRVSIGEPEANTRFLSVCADYTKAPRGS
ncbi:histidinol-phosphate transaminase [Pseudarthrobacter sp. J64]|uniref:histidinol-phosphate transaminase n=1 Tax=Pseudarthrobacter sp. J64 TaxID=3116485 RepID=UPI002E802C33|nr:histidinol-phosphate transaminase [Pseudarthrobacter sp. J64]MEE2570539.1 histidinol-phosphate transaminase [Pseudarthrobacter sp. J64]